jgi:hypothetical protein
MYAFNVANVTAFAGTQNIRTDPALPKNGDGSFKDVTFAHPFQTYFPGGDFYAMGTYKGTQIGTTNCVNDLNNIWSVYVDGRRSGLYFCDTIRFNAYGAGAQPYLRLARDTCPSGNYGWAAFDNGTRVDCRSIFLNDSVGSGAALEVEGNATVLANNTFNIDVKHLDLYVYSGGWVALGANGYNVDPRYSSNAPSSTRINSYLGVLD